MQKYGVIIIKLGKIDIYLLISHIYRKKHISMDDRIMKLILAGQSGYGILIENDAGYIDPKDNKTVINEIHKLGETNSPVPDPLIVTVVLQKYGVENKNGRWYPEEILKREATKYQELINNRAAVGESDHPECHHWDSEILTKRGWKSITEIANDEEILTLNPLNNNIEIYPITKYIKKPYKGDLIKLYSNNIDIEVTPNHKFWIKDRGDKGKFVTAQEIHNRSINDQNHCWIPKTGNWLGQSDDYFVINGLKEDDLPIGYEKKRCLEAQCDLKIPINVMMMFMGIYLSEGHVSNLRKNVKRKKILSNGDEKEYNSDIFPRSIFITQKKKENIILIEEMLKLFPLEWIKRNRPDGAVTFTVTDIRLHTFLHKLGKAKTKYIPQEIKNQSKENLELFFNWFLMGDGRIRGKKNKSIELFSTSETLVNDLQEIGLKIGYSGNIRKEFRKFDRIITENGVDRIIKGENSNDMFFYHKSTAKGIHLESIKTELVPYNDYVYCVEVPNHIFYVRKNGKALWCGNSSIITVDNVSHEIKEIWWEGNVLMGKMEILITKGFINYGICSTKGDRVAFFLLKGIRIGVSSRGVGTLEKVDGKNVVQDDYDLICWDVVFQPSTPGAYIFQNKEDAKPYMENTTKKENLIENQHLKNAIDNFLNIL